MNYRIRLGLS